MDVEKNRANGQLSDREELGMLESTMNYGCVAAAIHVDSDNAVRR